MFFFLHKIYTRLHRLIKPPHWQMSARAHTCTPWLVATLPSVVTTSRTMLPLAALVVVSKRENTHTCLRILLLFTARVCTQSSSTTASEASRTIYEFAWRHSLRAFPDERKKVILNHLPFPTQRWHCDWFQACGPLDRMMMALRVCEPLAATETMRYYAHVTYSVSALKM